MRVALAAAAAGLFCGLNAMAGLPEQAARTEWIRQHAAPVRSVDIADEDFSDLAPLAKAIGTARIVQLGEVTHGDGTTFLAKARIIRFLHQTMGFDVLLWEAPMLGSRLLDAGMRNPDMSVHEAAKNNIYAVWSESDQVMGTLEYVKRTQSTPRPIVSAGVDCRFGSTEQKTKIVPEFLLAFFDRIDPQLLSRKQRDEVVRICKTVEYSDYYNKPGERNLDMSAMKDLVAYLDIHSDAAAKRASGEEIDFVRQLLVSEIAYEDLCAQVGRKIERTSVTRDMIMGQNLLWQATRRFPDRKIIVWAHNFHIMEASTQIVSEEYRRAGGGAPESGPMGHVASRKLGREIYSLAFLGNSGSYAYADKPEEQTTITPASEGTLDWYLNQVDSPYSFLDLQGLPEDQWLRQPATARFYFWEEIATLWPLIYDGVFYIKNMEPSERVRQ